MSTVKDVLSAMLDLVGEDRSPVGECTCDFEYFLQEGKIIPLCENFDTCKDAHLCLRDTENYEKTQKIKQMIEEIGD